MDLNKSVVSRNNSLKKINSSEKIPLRAGLYSAILPGMGQYYNKKYWKIPLSVGAVGTAVGFIIYNNNLYSRYRNAFVSELNGLPHEFSGIPNVTVDVLGNVQDQYKRQRDYTIAIGFGVYILNIIDAVIDAHLDEGRKDKDLAINTSFINNNGNLSPALSLSLKF